MIVFFSQQPLEQYIFNKHLFMIVEAIHKLFPFIEYFIKIGFYCKEDVFYYFDKRRFINLPSLNQSQFCSLVEPILLLE